MKMISTREMQQMEVLLAKLFSEANDENEQSAILHLHHRLTAIFENQKNLRSSRSRLNALTEQTSL